MSIVQKKKNSQNFPNGYCTILDLTAENSSTTFSKLISDFISFKCDPKIRSTRGECLNRLIFATAPTVVLVRCVCVLVGSRVNDRRIRRENMFRDGAVRVVFVGRGENNARAIRIRNFRTRRA